MSSVPARAFPKLPLPARRAALLARIHAARGETVEAGQRLAVDLRATERTGRSLLAGFQLVKASIVAAGIIWSFSAASRGVRSRRFSTIALSLLGYLRLARKAGVFLKPFIQTPPRQGNTP